MILNSNYSRYNWELQCSNLSKSGVPILESYNPETVSLLQLRSSFRNSVKGVVPRGPFFLISHKQPMLYHVRGIFSTFGCSDVLLLFILCSTFSWTSINFLTMCLHMQLNVLHCFFPLIFSSDFSSVPLISVQHFRSFSHQFSEIPDKTGPTPRFLKIGVITNPPYKQPEKNGVTGGISPL